MIRIFRYHSFMRIHFACVVSQACSERSRRIESLHGQMSEIERQADELFASLLSEAFHA